MFVHSEHNYLSTTFIYPSDQGITTNENTPKPEKVSSTSTVIWYIEITNAATRTIVATVSIEFSYVQTHRGHPYKEKHQIQPGTYISNIFTRIWFGYYNSMLIPLSVLRPFGIILLSPRPCFAHSESCLSHKVCQPNLIKLVTTYLTPKLRLRLHISIEIR